MESVNSIESSLSSQIQLTTSSLAQFDAPQSTTEPITVLVTRAAGQIAYSLLYMIAKGDVFGPDQPLHLHLFDSDELLGVITAVATELSDCVLPLLNRIVPTADPAIAFGQVNAAFLIGTVRRMAHERDDSLLRSNATLFKEYGDLLDTHAHPDVRVLVLGDGANTNALICSLYAPAIAREHITAMTRLDENRARARIADKLSMSVGLVRNMIVWGNHSGRQLLDTSRAVVGYGPDEQTVRAALEATATSPDVSMIGGNGLDEQTVLATMETTATTPEDVADYLEREFIERCMQRHAQVFHSRLMTPAMSYARAASDHMRDWWTTDDPVAADAIVSMGVMSDGSYGLPEDIVCSFPVQIRNGEWSIVPDMDVGDYETGLLFDIGEELVAERQAAIDAVTRHDEMMAEWSEERAKEAAMREADRRAQDVRRCEYPVY